MLARSDPASRFFKKSFSLHREMIVGCDRIEIDLTVVIILTGRFSHALHNR